ncbi:MAG: VWA domain-containing protein, partial [Terracidiphilus sp.]
MHPHNAAIFFALSAALAPGGIVLAAQQAATPAPAGASSATTNTPGATISVKTQLVNLPVIVRDKKGALVQNLTKADFALSVDGRPQTIRYFDKDNDLPLTLGLLVDISGSVRSELENERAASEAFLDEMMTTPANRAPDQAFLIQFAHETELLQDLTSSRPKLRAALDRVGEQTNDSGNNTSGGSGNSGNGGYGHHRGSHGGGTTLYDAVFLAGDELMQKQTGRKALVVLTDGEDRGSMETLAQAIRSAQRAETVVYAVYFKGERYGQ